MAKHELICTQEIGDSFSGVYFVDECYIKLTQQGKEYSDLTLRDKSGSRNVKLWERTSASKGDFVFISAHVDDYQGSASIVAKSLEVTKEPDELGDYVAIYETDEYFDVFTDISEKLDELCEGDDDTCNLILDQVFVDDDFLDKFQKAVGSGGAHYGKIGGLFANTMRVAKYAVDICDNYGLTDVEKKVLICAAIIHRVGALDCYNLNGCCPEVTAKGYLMGVTNMTLARVTLVLSELRKDGNDLDKDIVLRIMHAIASCGENIKPMTKEAMVLSFASKADYEMVESMEFIEQDANKDQEFTAYDNRMGRRYFIGS